MVRLSIQVADADRRLAASPATTRYAAHAIEHLAAWFVDEATRMNPNLQYAQAIKGRVTGRGIGIIDTMHLVEVARAIRRACSSRPGVLTVDDLAGVKKWFADYLTWMTTQQERPGRDEGGEQPRHVLGDAGRRRSRASPATRKCSRCAASATRKCCCRTRWRRTAAFPRELKRTKPYGYSLFNADAMATVCRILSTPQDDLWRFERPTDEAMRKGVAFMAPYIADKNTWPHKPDVMYHASGRCGMPVLLFAGFALGEQAYLDLWKRLPADSDVDEVIRNFFVRQPLLWVD